MMISNMNYKVLIAIITVLIILYTSGYIIGGKLGLGTTGMIGGIMAFFIIIPYLDDEDY